MRYIRKLIGTIILIRRGITNRITRFFLKKSFRECGKNVRFDSRSRFSFSNISIGNDVYIGPNAVFSASNTEIRIGSKVLFGPNVTIMSGDHNTQEVGSYMFDVKTKNPDDDLPVIIENDVWVGANVIILKGVTIREGSIIAAGSVLTKSTEPYSIYMGVPAKFYKYRWDENELALHISKVKAKDRNDKFF